MSIHHSYVGHPGIIGQALERAFKLVGRWAERYPNDAASCSEGWARFALADIVATGLLEAEGYCPDTLDAIACEEACESANEELLISRRDPALLRWAVSLLERSEVGAPMHEVEAFMVKAKECGAADPDAVIDLGPVNPIRLADAGAAADRIAAIEAGNASPVDVNMVATYVRYLAHQCPTDRVQHHPLDLSITLDPGALTEHNAHGIAADLIRAADRLGQDMLPPTTLENWRAMYSERVNEIQALARILAPDVRNPGPELLIDRALAAKATHAAEATAMTRLVDLEKRVDEALKVQDAREIELMNLRLNAHSVAITHRDQLLDRDTRIADLRSIVDKLRGKVDELIKAGPITTIEPEWIVNDICELGVRVGTGFYWLYKGDSLVYGKPGKPPLHNDNDDSPDAVPMLWRPVGKREFGEVCRPLDVVTGKHPYGRYTVPLIDRDIDGPGWHELPNGGWLPIPAPGQHVACTDEQAEALGREMTVQFAHDPGHPLCVEIGRKAWARGARPRGASGPHTVVHKDYLAGLRKRVAEAEAKVAP